MIASYLTDGYMEDCYTDEQIENCEVHEAPSWEVAEKMAKSILMNIKVNA